MFMRFERQQLGVMFYFVGGCSVASVAGFNVADARTAVDTSGTDVGADAVGSDVLGTLGASGQGSWFNA